MPRVLEDREGARSPRKQVASRACVNRAGTGNGVVERAIRSPSGLAATRVPASRRAVAVPNGIAGLHMPHT